MSLTVPSCWRFNGSVPWKDAIGGWRLVARLWLCIVVCGCGSDDAAAGSETGPCYPNDTCNDGLQCLSGLCVTDSDAARVDSGAVAAADGGSAGPAGRDAGRDAGRPAASDGGGPSADGAMGAGDAASDVAGPLLALDDGATWIAFLKNQVLHLIRDDGTGLREVATRYPPRPDFGFMAGRVQGCPDWSPDGEKLAFVEDYELVVLDVNDGTLSVVGETRWRARARWTADGATIVVPSPEPILHAVDVATGDASEVIANAAGHDIAPDGTLYFIREEARDGGPAETMGVFMLPSIDAPAASAAATSLTRSDATEVAVHPDATRLLVVATQAWEEETGPRMMGLVEHNPASGDERPIGEPGDITPSYFPDGSALVLSREFPGGSYRDIAVTDPDGTLIRRLTEDDDNNVCPVVRPGS